MSQNLVLHLMLLKLKKILPLENYRLIEQEGQKLMLAFEHIHTSAWDCDDDDYIEINVTEGCIHKYNELRPRTTVSDTLLIRVICKYYTQHLPLKELQFLRCLEQGTLLIYDDWEIDFSTEEEKRQWSLQPEGPTRWLCYHEAFIQSERMSQLGKDQPSIQCPSEH